SQPEVVLSHGWIGFSVARALARTGIPLILSAHDYGYFCATRRLLHDGETCSGPAPRKCLTCSMDYYGAAKGATAAAGVAMSRRRLTKAIAGVQSVTQYVDEVMSEHLLTNARQRDG